MNIVDYSVERCYVLNLKKIIFKVLLLNFSLMLLSTINTAKAVEFNTDILDDDIKKKYRHISFFSSWIYNARQLPSSTIH